jgi:hypothetical protein
MAYDPKNAKCMLENYDSRMYENEVPVWQVTDVKTWLAMILLRVRAVEQNPTRNTGFKFFSLVSDESSL